MAEDQYLLEQRYLDLMQIVVDDITTFLGQDVADTVIQDTPIDVTSDGQVTGYYGEADRAFREIVARYQAAVGDGVAGKRILHRVRSFLPVDALSLLPADVREPEDTRSKYMSRYLTPKDTVVPVASVMCVLFLTVVAHRLRLQWTQHLVLFDIMPMTAMAATVFLGLAALNRWDGRIQQSVKLLVGALGGYGLVLHLFYLPYSNIGKPVILERDPVFWTGSASTLLAGLLLVSVYGTYRLKQVGSTPTSTTSHETMLGMTAHGWIILIALSGCAAGIGTLFQSLGGIPQNDTYVVWGRMLPALFCVGYLYINRMTAPWGGRVARSMELVGISLVMHILFFVPLIQWHIGLAPVVAGMDAGAVYLLLHGLSAAAFCTSAYGFYQLYRAGAS